MKRGAILFILLLAAVQAQTVTRSVNTSSVYVDGTVQVTLTVTVGSADAYAIDETIPSGWSVVSSTGDASTAQSQHLKWVVIGELGSGLYDCSGIDSCASSISDTTYSYVLQAPSTTGTGVITGIYMFDVTSSQNIPSTTITVGTAPPSQCSGYTTQATCSGAALDCAWCPLDSTCRLSSAVLCTSLGCYNTSHECRSTCNIVACGSGKECDTSQDACIDSDTGDTGDTGDAGDTGDTGNTGNTGSTTTCTSSWTCTDWTPAECPTDTRKQTRTCSDANSCDPATNVPVTTRTCRLSPSSTSTTTSTTDSTTRTRGTTTDTDTTTTTSSRSRTTASEDLQQRTTPKTTEEVLDENAETADTLFYVVLGIVILLIIGAFYYYKHKGEGVSLNKVDLSKQKQFVQQQNRFKPM